MVSAHRFKAIFHHRFGVTFSKDTEKFWHFASENTPDFYMPTLKKGTPVHCDKQRKGMCPKMLLYALDDVFHVFRVVRATDLDGQCIVAYEILLFASLCCMGQRGKPINPYKTCGDASTIVDVDDEKGLERWCAPAQQPLWLQARYDWARIIAGP